MARIIYGGRARLLTQSQQMWYNPLGDLDPSLIHAWQAITGDGRTIPDYATSLIDIAAGTQPLLDTPPVVTAPGWDAVNGWAVSNGLAGQKCLRFGFGLEDGDACFVRLSGAADALFYVSIGGNVVGVGALVISARFTAAGQHTFQHGNTPRVSAAPNVVSGVMAIVGQQGYLSGAPSGGALTPWAPGVLPTDCGVGGLLFPATASWQVGCLAHQIQLVAYYHAALAPSLTLAHIAAISARMAALAP